MKNNSNNDIFTSTRSLFTNTHRLICSFRRSLKFEFEFFVNSNGHARARLALGTEAGKRERATGAYGTSVGFTSGKPSGLIYIEKRQRQKKKK